MKSRTIGIVGGMGYHATSYFLDRIVTHCKLHSESDGQLPRMIGEYVPSIPSRHLAILGSGESPSVEINNALSRLVLAGSGLLAVACNTAHHFEHEFVVPTNATLISMLPNGDASFAELMDGARVAVLQSTSAASVSLWQRQLECVKATAVTITKPDQVHAQELIDSVKKNGPRSISMAGDFVECLERMDFDVVLYGCTEISMAMHGLLDDRYKVFDSVEFCCSRIRQRASMQA